MHYSLYITLGIFSSWLIFYSYILYLGVFEEDHFQYIIFNGKQLLKYISYLGIFILFSGYIFMIRLNRVGITLNIYEIGVNIYEKIHMQSWIDLFWLLIILSLIIIFLYLLAKLFYLNLRRRLLALYIYFYQYDFFRFICHKLVDIRGYTYFYLTTRVSIFTNNTLILFISRMIWPGLLLNVEPRLVKVIIPYLVVFDILTQDWIISKVFVILPWYYLYVLCRQTYLGMRKLFKQENIDLSFELYLKIEINGKIIRWVNLLQIPESFPRQS